MPRMLPDDLRVGPIRTEDQARAWIKGLHDHGFLYHFDDDVNHVINGETGEPLFADADRPLVVARVAELFKLPGFDPFEYALTLLDPPPHRKLPPPYDIAANEGQVTASKEALVQQGYNAWVAEALAERGATGDQSHHSLTYMLNEVLEWHGIVGYTRQIIDAVDNLRNMEHDR